MSSLSLPLAPIVAHLKRLRSDVSGIAMIEFGAALPFMLTLTLGGLELANLASANQRVSQIAMLVADNAGRVRTSIDVLDVNEVMVGAEFAGRDIGFGENGRVILSSFESNGLNGANAGFYIRWQRCFGKKNAISSYGLENDGKTTSTMANGIGASDRRIIPVPGTALMFAEVVYDYQHLLPNLFTEQIFPNRTITSSAAFTVRERTDNSLRNFKNIANTDRKARNCNTYSAT